MNRKYFTYFIITFIVIMLGVVYMKITENKNNNSQEVGKISIVKERQDYFKKFFQNNGWDLSSNEFKGMTAVNLMSDEDFHTANEYSKQIGLTGIEKYEMFKFAHTIQNYTLNNNNLSYDIDFMVQTDAEESTDIQFAVLVVQLNSTNGNETVKKWLFPVNADRTVIEKTIIEYADN